MILRACTLCGALSDEGRCPKHRSKPSRDTRPSASRRGYGARWRKTRAAVLAQDPSCRACGEPATELHHDDGLGPLGPAGHDPANLIPLCGTCHRRVTARTPRRAPAVDIVAAVDRGLARGAYIEAPCPA